MTRPMPDVPGTRRKMMSAVRGKDTGPEMLVRRIVHGLGYRYRLHRRDLPGRPDLAFGPRRKAIEVRGCFWHRHPGCARASLPSTRRDWWREKLDGNAARDARNLAAIERMGWEVLVLWECELTDTRALSGRVRDFLGPPARGVSGATPHETGKPGSRPVCYGPGMAGANPEHEAAAAEAEPRVVVDLFSCGGGMSAGFAERPGWRLAAAVDLEVAKPSGKAAGETGCNDIYEANHGIRPISADLAVMEPAALLEAAGLRRGETGCLISCAPCTDFSRANPDNHMADRDRNTLVGRSGDFAAALDPASFVMENARELITGNHPQHFRGLRERLVGSGYDVRADVHFLSRFGLPQVRERALIVASRVGPARTLEDLWDGWEVTPEAVTVRSALSRLDEWLVEHPDDPDGSAVPGMREDVLARLAATPADGGGWVDVARDPETRHLCTPDCLRRWEIRDLGSHPDVYGRMWWDRPAPTIKRECAHVGNGRYAHPERNRLLTVREMATLQGFPFTYRFPTKSVANRYRAIGDAVPPLVAWQIAACVDWSVTGRKPDPAEWVMPRTCLRLSDLRRVAGAPVTVRRAA
ncbi:DNA mismatch endonuclease Vsr [Craurococcus roseus]